MKSYRLKWLVIYGSNASTFDSFEFVTIREFESKEAAEDFSISFGWVLTREFDAFVSRSVRACRSQLAAEAASTSET